MALARSGLGEIVLVDGDDVCTSNVNRQVQATFPNVGRSKVSALADSLRSVNPTITIVGIEDFVTSDSLSDIFSPSGPVAGCDCVLDCVDGASTKASILISCLSLSLPVLTAGAAAGLTDPTKIVVEDLARARGDPLLQGVRKVLRKEHGYSKGPGDGVKNVHRPRKWNIPAVLSSQSERVGPRARPGGGSLRACDTVMGTAVYVTATFGHVAASWAAEVCGRKGEGGGGATGGERALQRESEVDQATWAGCGFPR
jgi:tRNA A37 threonylcarbamoyladenosine dehydratase